jgi:hypothetical protein
MLWSQIALTVELGVPRSSLSYHVMTGRCPAPTITVGKRKFYDAAGRDAVAAYWAAWRANNKEVAK